MGDIALYFATKFFFQGMVALIIGVLAGIGTGIFSQMRHTEERSILHCILCAVCFVIAYNLYSVLLLSDIELEALTRILGTSKTIAGNVFSVPLAILIAVPWYGVYLAMKRE